MSKFELTKNLLTGIEIVDAQHKSLIDIINRLYLVAEGTVSCAKIPGIMTAVVDYTRFHFDDEQREMKEAEYPAIQAHLADHVRLRGLFEAFALHFGQLDRRMAEALLDLLKGLFSDHILVMDKAFAAYLAKLSV